MSKSPENKRSLCEALSASQLYRDYERAFTVGTGLPLRFQAPSLYDVIRYDKNQENLFSTMISKSSDYCAQRYALQCKLQKEAQFHPKTLKCIAGLCETAVPVRVGENLIAFLHTGQVLLQRPNKLQFKQITMNLIKWAAEVDLKKLEEHYFNTRVINPDQYEALIRLLEIFAHHLSECGNVLTLQRDSGEMPIISRAREYISDHSDDELTLAAVAQTVNMSPTYFSSKFKEVTGISFVDYVARVRLEKACNFLIDPNRRVSDVAFEVGFQSLSQFNRTFKKMMGESPSIYRAKLPLVDS